MPISHAIAVRALSEDTLQLQDHSCVNRFSSVAEMGVVIETVASVMARRGYSHKDIFGTRLTLEEAICNAIKHGHQHDPTKVVEVRYCFGANHFLAEVEDQGPGFDLAQIPDATDAENLERPCGRGLLLMRHYATWVYYNPKGNCVAFCICPSEPLTAPSGVEPPLSDEHVSLSSIEQ